MVPATSFEALKATIERVYPELSEHLRRIARFTLEHPDEVALGTVVLVAKSASVQPSAVMRFAKAMGYEGFSEMQGIFRGNLLERTESYRERINKMRSHRKGEGRPIGVLHQLATEAADDLGRLEEHITQADMAKAVRLVANSPRVFLLAQRRSFPIASYLAYALSHLELKTHLLDGIGGMLQEGVRTIATGDVLIVASFRTYTPAVIEAAAQARRRGCAVIAITDAPLSPLKATANVCFELVTDSKQAFRSLVGPMCLAQALVVASGYFLEDKKQEGPGRRARNRSQAG